MCCGARILQLSWSATTFSNAGRTMMPLLAALKLHHAANATMILISAPIFQRTENWLCCLRGLLQWAEVAEEEGKEASSMVVVEVTSATK
jgi:hypothetical protein